MHEQIAQIGTYAYQPDGGAYELDQGQYWKAKASEQAQRWGPTWLATGLD